MITYYCFYIYIAMMIAALVLAIRKPEPENLGTMLIIFLLAYIGATNSYYGWVRIFSVMNNITWNG